MKKKTNSENSWVRDKDRLKAISVLLSFLLLTVLIYIAYNEGVRVGREEGATFMSIACNHVLSMHEIDYDKVYDPWRIDQYIINGSIIEGEISIDDVCPPGWEYCPPKWEAIRND